MLQNATCIEWRARQMLSFLKKEDYISVTIFKELEARTYLGGVAITEIREIIMWYIYSIFKFSPYTSYLSAQDQYHSFVPLTHFQQGKKKKKRESELPKKSSWFSFCVFDYSFSLQLSQPFWPYAFEKLLELSNLTLGCLTHRLYLICSNSSLILTLFIIDFQLPDWPSSLYSGNLLLL